MRFGICIERIRPGHPQQNGCHERMHLRLKKEATRPAGANLLQQQAKFDAFLEEFNNERPHEALDMKCPAELYSSSCRPYQGIQELNYLPRQDGRRHQLRPAVSLSQENQFKHLSGRPGRRRQRSRLRHLARQLHGLRSRLYRFRGENSAAPQQSLRANSVTYVLGTFCYPCLRAGQNQIGSPAWTRFELLPPGWPFDRTIG